MSQALLPWPGNCGHCDEPCRAPWGSLVETLQGSQSPGASRSLGGMETQTLKTDQKGPSLSLACLTGPPSEPSSQIGLYQK